jgi:glycerophosphoryl diester phosphodiesterase
VRPFLDHPAPLAFAHRGGAADAPENTMEAFAAAVELGFRYLETDVHLTSDGVLVAFHDASLDRVTDRSGRIAEMTWDEVARATVTGGATSSGGTGSIARMADLLEAFPDARFNIDPKADASVEPLAELITATGTADRVCVGAFSDRRVARVRALVGDELCTGLGPRAVTRLRLASLGLPVGRPGGDCAQVPPSLRGVPVVDRRLIDTAHRLGLQVHVWTIDDPAEMHRLCDLGVDGIMTDRPAVLRDVLQARGVWA